MTDYLTNELRERGAQLDADLATAERAIKRSLLIEAMHTEREAQTNANPEALLRTLEILVGPSKPTWDYDEAVARFELQDRTIAAEWNKRAAFWGKAEWETFHALVEVELVKRRGKEVVRA